MAADVEDELSHHLELRVAELIASGLSPADARDQALRRAGDLDSLKRECRTIGEERETIVRRREWWDMLRSDARIGVRQFVRSPVLSLVAITTLALGIGANTAIFSIVYSVLLRPLPFADADRMVVVRETARGLDTSVGPGQFTEWVQRNRSFEALSAQISSTFNLIDGGEPARIAAAYVTPSYFQTHLIPPAHGRYFHPEEADPGRDRVVILSYALFQQRFGGDATLIGQPIRLNGVPHTVVGVAPASYSLTRDRDLLWVPLALTAEHRSSFSDHWLTIAGKLKRGVSIAEAQRDLERVSREIAQFQPVAMATRSARVRDFHRDLVDQYDRQLTVLFGAVGFVLLLACLNVANLLLARVTVRRKEIAIRAALGASRLRIGFQFLVESMVLAVAGGVLSFAVARVVLSMLVSIAPTDVPRLEQSGHGAHLLLFLALATLASGALLGLVPAWRVSAGDLQKTLRAGGKGSAPGGARDPLRSALVVAEIALALVLLIGAGLFVRSAQRLYRIDPGYDIQNALTVRLSLPDSKYPTVGQVTHTYGEIIERLRALPNVRAVAASSQLPLVGGSVDVMVRTPGRSYAAGDQPFAHFRSVTANYFEAMRISLRRGRALTDRDLATAPPVVIVNETLARRLWPGEDPIGKQISCCAPGQPVWREVVGVAADVRHWLTAEPLPELYVNYEQAPPGSWIWFANSLALVIRTDGSPQRLLPAVRQVIAAVDPTVPLFDVRSLEDTHRIATSANRFSMLLLFALASLALVLAAVGIYGVLAYFVSQRTHEIGVRVALGAVTSDVIGMVLRQGAVLITLGSSIGLVLAFATSRVLNTLLYEIEPTDPLTYLAVTIGLALVALLACYAPARRAAAVDPMTSLRA